MREVMEGRAAPGALAGLLAALVMKGERPEEIAGLARTMREHAVPLATPPGEVFDTCGTGGDRSGTFNVSSAAAIVVAACGVKVAKHGNRSVSSRCGSADVFEQLGRQRHGAAARRGADASGREHRVLLRADVPPVDAARGADPERDGDPDDVQPARTAHQPGRRYATDRRGAETGADTGHGARADAARVQARVGRAWCRRHRRDLDHRSHEDLRVP